MPSKAYTNFLHIRIDVLDLIEAHSNYSTSKTELELGYLTRSAVVMLCAAWERYNEDLLTESIEYVCKSISDINTLDLEIKKTLSTRVKKDSHDLKPIELAGDGWKDLWKNYAKEETELLHTPKGHRLDLLFKDFFGIKEFSNSWKNKCAAKIDEFVKIRGEIAHNGNQANHVDMNTLRDYQDIIVGNVIEIDSIIALKIKDVTKQTVLPWVLDYSIELNTVENKQTVNEIKKGVIKSGKIFLIKGSNGQYYFSLKADNGQRLLASEGYTSKAACISAIETVKNNAKDETKYDRKESSNGKYYFNLKASNGQIIGTSEMYETSSGRDSGIEAVKSNAPGAKDEEE